MLLSLQPLGQLAEEKRKKKTLFKIILAIFYSTFFFFTVWSTESQYV